MRTYFFLFWLIFVMTWEGGFVERFHYLVPLDARQETERISPTAIVDIDGWETMDIGSSLWMQNIDHIAQQMEERLSLEGTVVAQRANELQTEAQKLGRQRAFLREERRRARMEEELLRQEMVDFSLTKTNDWIPSGCLPHSDGKRIRLNVGGQIFEACESVLRRDPTCLLAALCDDGGPLRVDMDGTVYVDRDWWIFRYVLKFLRDGILPRDTALLTQLYREAGYWHCNVLKRAIEEQMHLYRSTFEVDASGATRRILRENQVWWSSSPSRWEPKKVDAPGAKEDNKKSKKPQARKDWWTGSDYNGRQYTTLDTGDEVAATPKNEDVNPATLTTWSTGGNVQDASRPCIW